MYQVVTLNNGAVVHVSDHESLLDAKAEMSFNLTFSAVDGEVGYRELPLTGLPMVWFATKDGNHTNMSIRLAIGFLPHIVAKRDVARVGLGNR